MKPPHQVNGDDKTKNSVCVNELFKFVLNTCCALESTDIELQIARPVGLKASSLTFGRSSLSIGSCQYRLSRSTPRLDFNSS